jgi:hypothetical protein
LELSDLLQAQVSSGTAPAGLALPEPTAASLGDIGITYSAVDASLTRTNGGAAAPGVYRERTSDLTVLAADGKASGLVETGAREALFASVFGSHLGLREGTPLPLLVTVGPRRLEAASLIGSLRALRREGWIELMLGRDAADSTRGPKVQLVDRGADESAPRDYWPTVAEARMWARALASAYPTTTPEIEETDRNSLIAQGSAWAGVNNEWTPAWRGISFATQSRGVAEGKLKTVTLDVKPVTLAGTSGQVPVTISSEASETLQLTLVQEAGRSVQLGSEAERSIAVSPGENFLELPVELVNVLSGDLRVSLLAEDIELADDTVRLRASYLDRLALVGGVMVVLLVLLVFIITRVRAAQTSESDAESAARR